MKNIKLIFFVICILIFPSVVSAADIEYTIFDSNVKINKNRTIDVKENCSMYFLEDMNNISRVLETKITQTRPDESRLLINTKIKQVKSNTDEININYEKNNAKIEIPIDGVQNEVGYYKLSYNYNMGKDENSKYDEIYYNIVSNVPAAISNLTFTITLPTSINPKNVSFAIDGKYNLKKDDVTITYEDNVIIGTLNKLLEENQTFSIYIRLPEGYFVGATDNFDYTNFLILIMPIIVVIFSLIIWFKYGYKNKVVVYNYEDINNKFDPVEIGYLYKGKTIEIDMTTILIHLANEGYLKILENDDGYKLGRENTFSFVKLKDYDKNNAIQKIIFEHLFKYADTVELESVEYRFADKFNEAKSMIDNSDNNSRLFFDDIEGKKLVVFIGIVISVILMSFKPIHLFTGGYFLIFVMSALFIVGLYMFFISNIKVFPRIILGTLFASGDLYMSYSSLLEQPKIFKIYCIGIILIFLSMFLYSKLSSRTRFGNQKLSDAYSMKIYLETMSKEKLSLIQKDNPNFFFQMIPYAYTLDIFSKWIEKGKGIIKENPKWRENLNGFDIDDFKKFIENVLYNTTRAMLKRNYTGYENIKFYNTATKTKLND